MARRTTIVGLPLLVLLPLSACTTWSPLPAHPPRTVDDVVIRVHRTDGTEVLLEGPLDFALDEIRGTGVDEVCNPSFDRTRTVCVERAVAVVIPLAEVERVEAMERSSQDTVAKGLGIAVLIVAGVVYTAWEWSRKRR